MGVMGHCSTRLVFPENHIAQISGSYSVDRTQVRGWKKLRRKIPIDMRFFAKGQIYRQFLENVKGITLFWI